MSKEHLNPGVDNKHVQIVVNVCKIKFPKVVFLHLPTALHHNDYSKLNRSKAYPFTTFT